MVANFRIASIAGTATEPPDKSCIKNNRVLPYEILVFPCLDDRARNFFSRIESSKFLIDRMGRICFYELSYSIYQLILKT